MSRYKISFNDKQLVEFDLTWCFSCCCCYFQMLLIFYTHNINIILHYLRLREIQINLMIFTSSAFLLLLQESSYDDTESVEILFGFFYFYRDKRRFVNSLQFTYVCFILIFGKYQKKTITTRIKIKCAFYINSHKDARSLTKTNTLEQFVFEIFARAQTPNQVQVCRLSLLIYILFSLLSSSMSSLISS